MHPVDESFCQLTLTHCSAGGAALRAKFSHTPTKTHLGQGLRPSAALSLSSLTHTMHGEAPVLHTWRHVHCMTRAGVNAPCDTWRWGGAERRGGQFAPDCGGGRVCECAWQCRWCFPLAYLPTNLPSHLSCLPHVPPWLPFWWWCPGRPGVVSL